jgi:hypothetical protein
VPARQAPATAGVSALRRKHFLHFVDEVAQMDRL